MIRVLVVDDHPVVRAGLRAVLEASGDIQVVGEAAEGKAAVCLAEAMRPDVVLLDCRLPGMEGAAVARVLRERCPWARVVVLSAYADEHLVWGMLRAGAVGYVLKDEPPEEIPAAVRAAVRGRRISARRWLRGWQPGCGTSGRASLTAREREVLRWIVEGQSNKQIAATLGIGEHTVEIHIGNLLGKLEVASRAEAIAWAWRYRVLEGMSLLVEIRQTKILEIQD